MSLKKSTFAFVETQLYCYHDTVNYMKTIREEIQDSTGHDETGIKAGFCTSVTETKAIKLADHIMLREMKRICDGIERVYKSLPEEKQKLVVHKYWNAERKMIAELAEVLHCGETTVKRWREEIAIRVAMMLGWR